MKKILIAILALFLFCASSVLAETTRYEASDDGYITRNGSSYTSTDYATGGYILVYGTVSSATFESRAYKRFIMDLGSYNIVSATLYWYVIFIDFDNECTTACKLEQIEDYGILDATAAEFTGTVKHDYGNVIAWNGAPGWYSQDVTDEMETSKADPYVAFRWRLASIPTNAGDIDYFLGAYEYTAAKAYLVITYTPGWPHDRDGLANANIGAIDGLPRADCAAVDGLE